jgi:aminopeptidase N
MERWDSLFLNEGFATLFEYYVPHLMYPLDGFFDSMLLNSVRYSLQRDYPDTVPMAYYVESPSAIDGKFNFISYDKAGSVFLMFQEALSVDTFTKGLTKYLRKMEFKAAVPDDLYSSLQEALVEDNPHTKLNLIKIMTTWDAQGGFPLISVERSGDNITLTQQRFPSGGNGEIYSIPFTFATKSFPNMKDKNIKFWMFAKHVEVPAINFGLINADDWIIFNIQSTGYYRMAYSQELWRLIARELLENTSNIHYIKRLSLVDEASIGYYNVRSLLASDVLQIFQFLVNEDYYYTWQVAQQTLNTFDTRIFGTANLINYQKYNRFITTKQLERIGIESKANETTLEVNLRTQVRRRNCEALDDNCLTHELNKLMQYYLDEENAPVPNFCYAFRKDEILFSHYLEQVKTNVGLRNRGLIYPCLANTLKKEFINDLVAAVEDRSNILSESERIIIVQLMMRSSELALEAAFDYIKRNMNEISFFRYQLMEINSQQYYNELDELLTRAVVDEVINEDFAQSIRTRIEENLIWQARNADELTIWLERFSGRISSMLS